MNIFNESINCGSLGDRDWEILWWNYSLSKFFISNNTKVICRKLFLAGNSWNWNMLYNQVTYCNPCSISTGRALYWTLRALISSNTNHLAAHRHLQEPSLFYHTANTVANKPGFQSTLQQFNYSKVNPARASAPLLERSTCAYRLSGHYLALFMPTDSSKHRTMFVTFTHSQ